jgi:type II secretory pathway pseudopilin PulG
MVTSPSPAEVGTYSPSGSGFTMEQSAMETLQQQADELRTGYQDASSKLSGRRLAGDAFGTAAAFAAEAFNASTDKSVELAGKASSTLGLIGEALKATAQTHQEADRANGDQFAEIDPSGTAGMPSGTSAAAGGAPPPPQVPSPGEIPGSPGTGSPSQQGTPMEAAHRPADTTQTTGAEALSAQGGAGGVPASQVGGIPTGQMPPTPAMPPIPEVPKDLFKQPGIPDLATGGSPGGSPDGPDAPGRHTGERSPGNQADLAERLGRDGGESDHRNGDQHGFPITSVDGKPCLDLRDLTAADGERWQENIRDILATKGEGSFFWAGDTIDAEGRRHSFMDLAEFMANLDGRSEPDHATEATGQPARDVSDTVATSPAHSANGDVYVLIGPNRSEDDPVELTDFPALQANPRIERVFAIDAVTGRETQIHPKLS